LAADAAEGIARAKQYPENFEAIRNGSIPRYPSRPRAPPYHVKGKTISKRSVRPRRSGEKGEGRYLREAQGVVFAGRHGGWAGQSPLPREEEGRRRRLPQRRARPRSSCTSTCATTTGSVPAAHRWRIPPGAAPPPRLVGDALPHHLLFLRRLSSAPAVGLEARARAATGDGSTAWRPDPVAPNLSGGGIVARRREAVRSRA
jgi:hypothetical protein